MNTKTQFRGIRTLPPPLNHNLVKTSLIIYHKDRYVRTEKGGSSETWWTCICKNRLCMLFALIMIALVWNAAAEDAATGAYALYEEIVQPTNPQDFSYSKHDDGTVCITKYNGTEEVIVIPAEISGQKVTEIGKAIFGYNNFITSVTLPRTIVCIGESAFESCQMLLEINIPDTVVQIGSKAFRGCEELMRIDLPDSVTEIGDSVFSKCTSLEQVILPEGITRIPEYAFGECISLPELMIPASVTEICDSAFQDCKNLIEIELPKGIKSIGKAVFSKCESLVHMTIPEGIISIEIGTFEGCHGLESIVIPNSVRTINAGAFRDCYSLKEIMLPENVSLPDGSVFEKCSSLNSISLPENMNEIPEKMFLECSSLKEIWIPESCEAIGRLAFAGCTSLSSVHLPDNLKVLGEECFKACISLNDIVVPAGIQRIDNGVFYGNAALTDVSLPDSLRFIPENMFSRCTSLERIRLPEGIEYIDSYAFSQCFKLSLLEFPDSLLAIDKTCFNQCDELKEVHCVRGSYAEIWAGQHSLSVIKAEGMPQNIRLASLNVEQDKDGRKLITGCGEGNLLVFPYHSFQDGSYIIAPRAFKNNTDLEYVVFLGSCREIGREAFQGCTSLKKVTGHMPPILNEFAFASCSSLTTLPPGTLYCTSVENYAFSECDSLRSIRIEGISNNLGTGVFGHCDSLEEVYLTVNIEDIHKDIASIDLWRGGVLWHEVFVECPNLKVAVISGIAWTVPVQLFKSCPKLETIRMPICRKVNEKVMGSHFNLIALDCPGLKTVYVKNLKQADAQPRFYPEGVQIIPDDKSDFDDIYAQPEEQPSPLEVQLTSLPATDTEENAVMTSQPVEEGRVVTTPQPEYKEIVEPIPEPTSVRVSAPMKITLHGKLSKSHSLNQLNGDMKVGFTLTLNADGSVQLDEGYPEGYFNYHGKWYMKDGQLVLKLNSKATALEQRIPVSDSTIHFRYFGERIDRELTLEEEAFLTGTVGGLQEQSDSNSEMPASSLQPQYKDPIDIGPGLCSVPVTDTTADTWIKGKDPTAYTPIRMTDGDEHTAWQFSTKESKLKETYAYFSFEESQEVDALWIKNGFWKVTDGLDQYVRNSRVKELGIAFRYEGSNEWMDKMTVKLKDDKKRKDWQKIDLGLHSRVTGIRFRIMSIYKGTKFSKDVCISEVMFVRSGQ